MEPQTNSNQEQNNLNLQNIPQYSDQSQINPIIIEKLQQTSPNIVEYNEASISSDKQTLAALKMFKSIFNEKQDWNLTCKKWLRLKLKKVFENLSLALPKKIDLTQNYQPLLLDSLVCISIFPCLKELKLCNNKISNLEKLTLIDFPVLQELNLSDNDILEIKSLKKVNFRPQNIKKVAFYANRILSIDSISRVSFVKGTEKEKKGAKGQFTTTDLGNLLSKIRFSEEKNEDDMMQKQDESSEQNCNKYQDTIFDAFQSSEKQETLPALSLIFGINQIRSIQEINKLQRETIQPRRHDNSSRMKECWQRSSQQSSLVKSFDAQEHKNNRKLMLSAQLNKYFYSQILKVKLFYQFFQRTIFKLNYNYFKRNYLPHDIICA